jgi:hypothetical protein
MVAYMLERTLETALRGDFMSYSKRCILCGWLSMHVFDSGSSRLPI